MNKTILKTGRRRTSISRRAVRRAVALVLSTRKNVSSRSRKRVAKVAGRKKAA